MNTHTVSREHPPAILCLSGHDPTGGAGLQADIETIGALGGHACGVITALTVQDTRNVRRVIPQTSEDFREQLEVLLADLPIAAIKIGLLGSAMIARIVAHLLARRAKRTVQSAPVFYPHPDPLPQVDEGMVAGGSNAYSANCPVILDPILAAGGGSDLANAALLDVIRHELLPYTTVLTPNSVEARRLTGCDNLDDCAERLLGYGAQTVLITGTHEAGTDVINTCHDHSGWRQTWRFLRLPHSYHGSGCTLASAIAALLAQQTPLVDALEQAQQFTWQALQRGFLPGHGQHLPHRFNPHGEDAP